MPDPRFYEDLGPVPASELARLAGARTPQGAATDRPIFTAAPLDMADERSVSFFSDRRYLADLERTAAGACFVAESFVDRLPPGCLALVTAEPQAAFARAAMRLHRVRRHEAADPQLHPTAVIEDGAELGHGVVVGPGARIGSGARIDANVVIGPGVAIGRNTIVGANSTIGFALIGDEVRLLAGVVVGEAGFGVAVGRTGPIDVPQFGRVIIQDHVSIGAGACVDRGAWNDTVIGEGCKIDNLVQIGHNVRLGRNCLLAGQVGLSGSVTAGDGVVFGGGAAVADHITIGSGAQIAAEAGVMHDVPPGERWGGTPAKPIRRFMRESAWLAKMAAAREGSAQK